LFLGTREYRKPRIRRYATPADRTTRRCELTNSDGIRREPACKAAGAIK
jgi:hypothetical protein